MGVWVKLFEVALGLKFVVAMVPLNAQDLKLFYFRVSQLWHHLHFFIRYIVLWGDFLNIVGCLAAVMASRC